MLDPNSRATSESDIVTLDSAPHHFYLGHFGALSVVVWAAQPDLAAMQRMAVHSPRMVERYPNGRSTVSFVLNGVPPLADDAREAMARYYTQTSGVACSAMILEGGGHWAATIRSTALNLSLTALTPSALEVADSIHDLVPRLARVHARRTGNAIPEDTLSQALHRIRHEVAPPLLFPDASAAGA